jgi:hypothetical protein
MDMPGFIGASAISDSRENTDNSPHLTSITGTPIPHIELGKNAQADHVSKAGKALVAKL